MVRLDRRGYRAALAAVTLIVPGTVHAAPPGSTAIATIDLSKDFGLRRGWSLTATQEPKIEDSLGEDGTSPGAIHLCLRNGGSGRCAPDLGEEKRGGAESAPYSEPHYLDMVRTVHPRGNAGRPLLLIRTSSLHSGNGNQLTTTQVLGYQPESKGFTRLYRFGTGHNNNEEVRYIDAGPLEGSIISAEPTGNAPFGFWITVNSLTPAYSYRQVLRYRSATRYADGNPLAVIDSEMPNIQRHLGQWRPGRPLPLPARPCPKPRLVNTALWCS